MKRKNAARKVRSPKSQRDATLVPILSLARQIEGLKRQGAALGLFVEDRDLLECPGCGLQEDVAFGGQHLVTLPADRHHDTGLRFSPMGRLGVRWKCPNCGSSFSHKS